MKDIKFNYTQKIEDMSLEQLSERIKVGYEYETPKLTILPYIGLENEVIEYKSEELNARCPATGYPDTYHITIKFIPDKTIPELKSLRFYFMSFYNIPISHEHLASKVFKEFDEQVNPNQLEVLLDVAVRGSIRTKIKIGSIT